MTISWIFRFHGVDAVLVAEVFEVVALAGQGRGLASACAAGEQALG
jgi:hypothetical protein